MLLLLSKKRDSRQAMEQKNRLVFEAELKRNKYFRRFMWMLLATVASGAAWIALDEVAGRGEADADLLMIGKWAALIAVLLLALRALLNLIIFFRTKNESVMVTDRGFVWNRGKQQHKYRWNLVRSFTEGARSLHLFGRPFWQRGAQTIITRDGKTFKFRPRLGDPQAFAEVVGPLIAEPIAEAMTRALREKKTIRMHPQLAMNAAGVIAGKEKIRWSQVDISVKRSKLGVYRLNNEGKFQTVRSYDIHTVENLHGFLDVADSAMRTHQPKRFNIKARI